MLPRAKTRTARYSGHAMLKALDDLESTGLDELATVADAASLEQWRVCYLGTKGRLKAILPRMKTVAAGEKPGSEEGPRT